MAALPLVVTQLRYLATSAFLSLLPALPFSDMTTVELPPRHSLTVDNFHIRDNIHNYCLGVRQLPGSCPLSCPSSSLHYYARRHNNRLYSCRKDHCIQNLVNCRIGLLSIVLLWSPLLTYLLYSKNMTAVNRTSESSVDILSLEPVLGTNTIMANPVQGYGSDPSDLWHCPGWRWNFSRLLTAPNNGYKQRWQSKIDHRTIHEE